MSKDASGEKSVERDYSKSASLRLLLRLVAPYRTLAVFTVLALLCDITGMLYIPTELSALINTAVSSTDASGMLAHGISMLVAAVVGSGGCLVSYWLASRLAARVGRDMRVAVYEKSLELGGYDFDQLGTGSMITRTLSDANVVQQTFLMTFIMLAPVPVICVVAIVLAFGIDYVMGWLLLAITLVMGVVMVIAVKASAPIFLVLQGFIDNMNTRLRETITGIRVIRAFGREDAERRNLDATFEDYARNAIHVNLVFATADCMTFFLMNVVEVLVVWLGADRVGVHAMQIGSISALVEYAMLIMFFMMMGQFAILQLPRAMACLTRASEVLAVEPRVRDKKAPAELPAADPSVPVARFDHVSFRFADADEDTLRDLSFGLRRGEVTAVIGSTGSGKSTIAKMLLRFHDVTAGRIEFLGKDVRNVGQHELRDHIAYVPQKAWLFSGTIAQNLRGGNPDATDEELWQALEVAQAADFVRQKPQGLDEVVEAGGKNFSGGQRQRLTIARALVGSPRLLLLDDSASALDFATDAALRRAIHGLGSNLTTVIVSQRVSAVMGADQILVLSHGEVAGLGTHRQLLKDCQIYREICLSQLKKEEVLQ